MGQCKISGCTGLVHGQGLCNLHYRRLRKHGNVNKSLLNRTGIPIKCKIFNCNKDFHARGYCYRHYKNYYYRKNPEKVLMGCIRQYKKFGIVYNLSSKKYKYALMSWSRAVRKRDNYTCQICGKYNKEKTIAHHLIYRVILPLFSLNINNGITLCKECHLEIHYPQKHINNLLNKNKL